MQKLSNQACGFLPTPRKPEWTGNFPYHRTDSNYCFSFKVLRDNETSGRSLKQAALKQKKTYSGSRRVLILNECPQDTEKFLKA